jgi:hypothetical protein
MFQRSQQEQYQRRQEIRIETMLQLVEPLKKYWPELVVLLNRNMEINPNPTHLGEILAEEFQIMMDRLGREHQRRIDEQYRKAYDREKELSSTVEQLTKEKGKYSRTIQILDEKNQEQARQIRVQNSLIADLHRQISNLTGAEDSSSR